MKIFRCKRKQGDRVVEALSRGGIACRAFRGETMMHRYGELRVFREWVIRDWIFAELDDLSVHRHLHYVWERDGVPIEVSSGDCYRTMTFEVGSRSVEGDEYVIEWGPFTGVRCRVEWIYRQYIRGLADFGGGVVFGWRVPRYMVDEIEYARKHPGYRVGEL